MSLALAEVSEFAVVREHLVGYRQSSTTMSKNVAAMKQAFEGVARMDRPPLAKHANQRQTENALSRKRLFSASSDQQKRRQTGVALPIEWLPGISAQSFDDRSFDCHASHLVTSIGTEAFVFCI